MTIDRNSTFYWVADPAGGGDDAESRKLIDRRADIELIGGVTDAEADYTYDDYALIRLDGAYYLLNTSGCSCPSPTETWGISIGPSTLDEIEAYLISEAGERKYGVTKRQHNEFLALVKLARESA